LESHNRLSPFFRGLRTDHVLSKEAGFHIQKNRKKIPPGIFFTFHLSGKKIASTVIYVKPAVERSTSIISTHVNKKPRRKQQQTKHQPNE